MKKIHNLKLFGLVAILTVSLVFIGVNFIEGQVKTQVKPDKLGKPDKPKAEWIQFTGDLDTPPEGEVVYGCCPNRGPFPEYTMILRFDTGIYPVDEPIDGWLYINYYGAGRDQKYKVQFWTNYDLDHGIEIIGGEIHHDRETKVLTVTFEDDECVYIKSKDPIQNVSFTLERYIIRNLE